MNELELKPTYWASVSGGKDSLYMLNLILNNLDKYPLDGVIHFELEIDYPFIKDVIKYMEARCKEYNIPFIRIKPRKTWDELYNKNGFPTRKNRWCNSQYKIDCKKQFDKFKKEHGYRVIYYIGYCVDEFNRYGTRKDIHERYPLVEEGIIENYILQWARNVPIFNDFYIYNARCGCMYCPLQSLKESAYLRKYYPDNYNYMMKLAKETEEKIEKELGRPFSIWQSNPKYNTEYRMKRIEEMIKEEQYETSQTQSNTSMEKETPD